MSPSDVFSTKCVYWDETRNLWSTDGGNTAEVSKTNYTCSFNHLTNFATAFVSTVLYNMLKAL